MNRWIAFMLILFWLTAGWGSRVQAATPTGTGTPAWTPTITVTAIGTTGTATATPTTTATLVVTPGGATLTRTPTGTGTPAWTPTITVTAIGTTGTATATSTRTATPVVTPGGPTQTSTPTATVTTTAAAPANTFTPTVTPTPPAPLGTATPTATTTVQVRSEDPVVIRNNVIKPGTSESATISVKLDQPEHVLVRIYTLQGKLIKTVTDTLVQAGTFEAVWDGLNEKSRLVRSGVYIVYIKTDSFEEKRRIVVIR